jgi:hypothetical protein
MAEVDEHVAGDDRTMLLDPENGLVRLPSRKCLGSDRQQVTRRIQVSSPLFSRNSQARPELPSPACSAVMPHFCIRSCAQRPGLSSRTARCY